MVMVPARRVPCAFSEVEYSFGAPKLSHELQEDVKPLFVDFVEIDLMLQDVQPESFARQRASAPPSAREDRALCFRLDRLIRSLFKRLQEGYPQQVPQEKARESPFLPLIHLMQPPHRSRSFRHDVADCQLLFSMANHQKLIGLLRG